MIAKIRLIIPSSILSNIYYAFIHSHINYSILNWGSATPYNLETVKVSMRKDVRLMAFQQRDAHSEPLFNNSISSILMPHTDLKLPNSCMTSLTINFINLSKVCFH